MSMEPQEKLKIPSFQSPTMMCNPSFLVRGRRLFIFTFIHLVNPTTIQTKSVLMLLDFRSPVSSPQQPSQFYQWYRPARLFLLKPPAFKPPAFFKFYIYHIARLHGIFMLTIPLWHPRMDVWVCNKLTDNYGLNFKDSSALHWHWKRKCEFYSEKMV